jgi:5-methylcytosine-specific restriction enzyme subunit McrC
VEFPSPLRRGCRLVSRGWVGAFAVEGTLLRVVPKTPVQSLFALLAAAHALPSFAPASGLAPGAAVEAAFDALAALLASGVLDRSRRGLYRSYVAEEEELTVVRGRIDWRRTAERRLAGSAGMACAFEELSADVEDNALLAWTLFRLTRAPLDERVRRRVREAFRAVGADTTLRRFGPDDCLHREYDRLNEDYRPLHALCRFFLEHAAPDLRDGAHDTIPFAIHMPTLFERFVARLLARRLDPRWKAAAQVQAPVGELTFRMDVVIRKSVDGEPVAVLDTKYKTGGRPSEADVQQVVAYAARLRCRTAILVYPGPMSPRVLHAGNVDVHLLPCDLGLPLELAAAQLVAAVDATVSAASGAETASPAVPSR